MNSAQPLYLPPVATTSQNLISRNSIEIKDHEQNFSSGDDKAMIKYLQKISSPRQNSPMLKSQQYHSQEHDDRFNYLQQKGNPYQLESIGNIGLHLSDFETEVRFFFKYILFFLIARNVKIQSLL